MSVSYDKELRRAAKERGEQLATVAVGGLEFQGPVTLGESLEIVDLIRKLFKQPAPVEPVDTSDPRM